MRLSELIEALQDMQEDWPDDDPEVLMAIQPNWPLAKTFGGAVLVEDEPREEGEKGEPIVWLVDGDQHPFGRSPYASRDLWQLV